MVFPASFTTEEQIKQEMIDAGGKKQWLENAGKRMHEIEVGFGGSRSDVPIDPNHEYRILEQKVMLANRVEVPVEKKDKQEENNERK